MTVPDEDRATVLVAADPLRVWQMVSDITRMGEWSPECFKAFWLSRKRGPGAMFLGLNKDRGLIWPAPAIVTVSERGKAFAFRAVSGVTWRYSLAPEGGGTRLVEERVTTRQFRFVRVAYGLFLGGYQRRLGVLRVGMHTTLERIKAAAEQDC
jgi:dimethylaniline monooxygenase (N-oxide forming)